MSSQSSSSSFSCHGHHRHSNCRIMLIFFICSSSSAHESPQESPHLEYTAKTRTRPPQEGSKSEHCEDCPCMSMPPSCRRHHDSQEPPPPAPSQPPTHNIVRIAMDGITRPIPEPPLQGSTKKDTEQYSRVAKKTIHKPPRRQKHTRMPTKK